MKKKPSVRVQSNLDDGRRFVPCPGGAVGIHPQNVFLELEHDSTTHRTTVHCRFCQFKGEWTPGSSGGTGPG